MNLVSLCMIVKDEEDELPLALRSAVGLVDEIVIYDTGSSDGTVAVARQLGRASSRVTGTTTSPGLATPRLPSAPERGSSGSTPTRRCTGTSPVFAPAWSAGAGGANGFVIPLESLEGAGLGGHVTFHAARASSAATPAGGRSRSTSRWSCARDGRDPRPFDDPRHPDPAPRLRRGDDRRALEGRSQRAPRPPGGRRRRRRPGPSLRALQPRTLPRDGGHARGGCRGPPRGGLDEPEPHRPARRAAEPRPPGARARALRGRRGTARRAARRLVAPDHRRHPRGPAALPARRPPGLPRCARARALRRPRRRRVRAGEALGGAPALQGAEGARATRRRGRRAARRPALARRARRTAPLARDGARGGQATGDRDRRRGPARVPCHRGGGRAEPGAPPRRPGARGARRALPGAAGAARRREPDRAPPADRPGAVLVVAPAGTRPGGRVPAHRDRRRRSDRGPGATARRRGGARRVRRRARRGPRPPRVRRARARRAGRGIRGGGTDLAGARPPARRGRLARRPRVPRGRAASRLCQLRHAAGHRGRVRRPGRAAVRSRERAPLRRA